MANIWLIGRQSAQMSHVHIFIPEVCIYIIETQWGSDPVPPACQKFRAPPPEKNFWLHHWQVHHAAFALSTVLRVVLFVHVCMKPRRLTFTQQGLASVQGSKLGIFGHPFLYCNAASVFRMCHTVLPCLWCLRSHGTRQAHHRILEKESNKEDGDAMNNDKQTLYVPTMFVLIQQNGCFSANKTAFYLFC